MIVRKPVPHVQAARMIESKPVVSREVFRKLPAELKGRAFTVAGIELAGVLQDIRDRIADLPKGALWDDVKSDLAADMVPYLVDDSADAETRDAQMQAAMRRSELLLRIHGFQAYNMANWEVMDRQRDVLPYWQYHSMEDGRVRPAHAALDGVILPADSPFWRDHYPPWDWGCRCLVTPLSEEDARRIQEEDQGKAPESHRFMDGAALRKLEEEGMLIRKEGAFSVTSPHAKGVDGAFWWDPNTLRMPPTEIEKRYDPEVWNAFRQFAQGTKLGKGDGRTVWEWLEEGPRTTDNRPQTTDNRLQTTDDGLPAGGPTKAGPRTRGRTVTVGEEDSSPVAESVLHSEAVRRLKDAGFDRVEIATVDVVPARTVEMLERDARLVSARGIVLPPRVALNEAWFTGMYGKLERKHPAAYDEKTGAVMINGHRYAAVTPDKLKDLMHQGAISTGDVDYLLLHESAHRLHYGNAPVLYGSALTERQRQLAMNWISRKATVDAAEFVAETFCAIKTGKGALPKEVLETFRNLGGTL